MSDNWNTSVTLVFDCNETDGQNPGAFYRELRKLLAMRVKTAGYLTISSDDDEEGEEKTIRAAAPEYHCRACGGTEIQHSFWHNPNTGEVFDEFGSWCNGDNSWCKDCSEHTDLITPEEWVKVKRERELDALRFQVQQKLGPDWRPCRKHLGCWHNEETHENATEAELRQRLKDVLDAEPDPRYTGFGQDDEDYGTDEG